MPRHFRLDVPGLVHHVTIRGIDHCNIFQDDPDRDSLLERLAILLSKTKTKCYAWSLMPDHAHFLFRSGIERLSTFMQRLLTGYVVGFNHRHGRKGPLLQNRYKSIVCQEKNYLKELVRYIHLNPLRAGLVAGLNGLASYPYCGHGVLLGIRKRNWQNIDYVLGYFGPSKTTAQRNYLKYIEAGVVHGHRDDLIGGGLIRSIGGWTELKKRRTEGLHVKSDERILGDSHFVESILSKVGQACNRKYEKRRSGFDLDKLVERVGHLYEMAPEAVINKSRQRQRVEARSVLCYWAVRELGMGLTELARRFELTPSAVWYASVRGERIVQRKHLKLIGSD